MCFRANGEVAENENARQTEPPGSRVLALYFTWRQEAQMTTRDYGD